MCYREGRGVPRNALRALLLLVQGEAAGSKASKEALDAILEKPQDFPFGLTDDTDLCPGMSIESAAVVRGIIAYNRRNFDHAVPWLTKAAEAGNTMAMMLLNRVFLSPGPQKDEVAALAWAEKAAALGQPSALIWLAARDLDNPEAGRKALDRLNAAADRGNFSALNMLGMLFTGPGPLVPNPTNAFIYFERGAFAGEERSEFGLATLYATGTGTAKNPLEAIRWFGRAFLDGNDDALPAAEKLIADVEATEKKGEHPPISSPILRAALTAALRDDVGAYELWKKEADAGNSIAQCAVGLCLLEGRGTTRDLATALTWFQKAAVAGNAEAMRHLGDAYMQGQGVPIDHAKAFTWYKQAAEAHDPDAMYQLALLYVSGDGTPQDRAAASRWMEDAATARQTNAMFAVSVMFISGEGATKDPDLGLKYLQNAAWKGHPSAMFNLGTYCLQGTFSEKDLKAALYWFKRGANVGSRDAMYNAGILLIDGRAGEKDEAAGKAWIQKAADAGMEEAKALLKMLGARPLTGESLKLNEVPAELH